MVHALTQAHRVLAPHGLVLDLRPARDPGGRREKLIDTYVLTARSEVPAGALVDSSYYADFVAGDRAVEQVIRQHLFSLQAAEIFPLRWHFRTLEILEKSLATDWVGTNLPDPVRRRLRNLLGSHRHAQIAVAEVFRLNVLRKQ